MDSSDIPIGYMALVNEQEALGWSHLWHARWSVRWADYQRDYDTELNIERTDRNKWMRVVTTMILDHMHRKWIRRGKAMSGADGTAGVNGLRERAEHLHRLKDQLPHQYGFLFRVDLHQRLTQDNKVVQTWLNMTEPIILRAIRRLRRKKQKETRLERWMGGRRKTRRRKRAGIERVKRWQVRRRHQRKEHR